MTTTVTRTEQIVIAASLDAVWEYTQDYCRRWEWDATVLIFREGEGTGGTVHALTLGGLRCTLRRTLVEHPRRSGFLLVNVESPWVAGGGGEWLYEPTPGGTRWTQTNSLVVQPDLPPRQLRLLIAWQLGMGTRRAMEAARTCIEAECRT
ncbi:MAG: SRPBCC family protein [Dehalococcoidia bacterium]